MSTSYRGLGYKEKSIRIVNKERSLQSDELLIKVLACGICGTDIHIIEGDKGSVETKVDTILGHEFAGIVEEVGEGTYGFQKGDLVSIDPNIYCHECQYCKNHQYQYCEKLQALGVNLDGGFSDYCFVPYKQAYKVKGNISPREAAMMEPIACCLHGLEQLHIQPGQSALVIGAGAIGNIFVQLLQSSGLSVTVTDINTKKLEYIKSLGVNNVYHVSGEGSKQFPNELYDIVIETAGASSETIGFGLKYAQKGAQILLFSVPNEEITMDARHIFEKELKIMGSFINPGTNAKALQMIENKQIDANQLITNAYKLEDFKEAFEEAKKQDSLKVIIEGSH